MLNALPLADSADGCALTVPKFDSCAVRQKMLQISGDSAIHSAEDCARPEPLCVVENVHPSDDFSDSVNSVPLTDTSAVSASPSR